MLIVLNNTGRRVFYLNKVRLKSNQHCFRELKSSVSLLFILKELAG